KIYFNASFFKDVFDLIENIILTKENSIAGLNYYTIIEINKFLGINTEIVKTSSKYENNDIKGEERIIDICRIEKSEVYVNPIGGVDLYKKTKFDLNGISLKFIKSNELVYNQSDNSFIPDLSIIDVMMNNSRNSVKNYLNDYTLV
ncbi:MAG: WbqC family protein, partial [Ignavibacteria bacterium]